MKRDLLKILLAMVLVTVVFALLIYSEVTASADALVDGETPELKYIKVEVETAPKRPKVKWIDTVRVPKGRIAIPDIIEVEDEPNYRDPANPAPLVGWCPIEEEPDFCYKSPGHP